MILTEMIQLNFGFPVIFLNPWRGEILMIPGKAAGCLVIRSEIIKRIIITISARIESALLRRSKIGYNGLGVDTRTAYYRLWSRLVSVIPPYKIMRSCTSGIISVTSLTPSAKDAFESGGGGISFVILFSIYHADRVESSFFTACCKGSAGNTILAERKCYKLVRVLASDSAGIASDSKAERMECG